MNTFDLEDDGAMIIHMIRDEERSGVEEPSFEAWYVRQRREMWKQIADLLE